MKKKDIKNMGKEFSKEVFKNAGFNLDELDKKGQEFFIKAGAKVMERELLRYQKLK